jgi:poly(3-hydroxybutyrate) depolymerase
MRALALMLFVTIPVTACDAGDAADAGRSDGGVRDARTEDATASDVSLDTPADAGPPAWQSAGCIDGEGLPEGETTFTLQDRERRYVVRLPVGYTRDRAWPLVLALHGNGGSVSEWDVTSGGHDIRSVLANDAILIVTEAIDRQWRDYEMAADTWPDRIESELLYFDTILDRAQSALCIDTEAIFSMGFSGGGSFSGVLACRRDDIRAIAVGGAVIYFDEAECTGSSAAWITIGDMETNAGRVAYRDFFRDRAGCSEASAPANPDTCIAYDDCDAATPVTFCSHPAGHVWPDFASAEMWAFFSQFVRAP